MNKISCEQCGRAIELVRGKYVIVGIKQVGRSWPSVYVHRGKCLKEWRAEPSSTTQAQEQAT